MDERINNIKVPIEKMTQMFMEKDYLVKLLVKSIKRENPEESDDVVEAKAIGLLNHYSKLENEIYFAEKVNGIVNDLEKQL